MAAHDTQASGTWTSGTSFTWNHTVGSGADILIGVFWEFHALSVVTGVTVGGSAATLVSRVSNGAGGGRLEVWKHESPTAGSQAVVVTFDSAPSEACGASASTTGSSGYAAGITAGPTSSTTPSVTVTSLGASDMPYGFVGTITDPTESDTAVVEVTQAPLFLNVIRQATGGDGVMNWTTGVADEWLAVGVRAIDAGGGAVDIPTPAGSVPHTGRTLTLAHGIGMPDVP